MTIQIFATRFALALFLGALIGLEREWRQRMAGTRTNTLVAGGAAAFAMSGGLILGGAAAQARTRVLCSVGSGILGRWGNFQRKRPNSWAEYSGDDLVLGGGRSYHGSGAWGVCSNHCGGSAAHKYRFTSACV